MGIRPGSRNGELRPFMVGELRPFTEFGRSRIAETDAGGGGEIAFRGKGGEVFCNGGGDDVGVGVRDFGRPNIEMVLIRVDPAGELSAELPG